MQLYSPIKMSSFIAEVLCKDCVVIKIVFIFPLRKSSFEKKTILSSTHGNLIPSSLEESVALAYSSQ